MRKSSELGLDGVIGLALGQCVGSNCQWLWIWLLIVSRLACLGEADDGVLQLVEEVLEVVGDAVLAHTAAASRSRRTPRSKRAPVRTSATKWGALTARQQAFASSRRTSRCTPSAYTYT